MGTEIQYKSKGLPRTRFWDWFDTDFGRFFERFEPFAMSPETRIRVEEEETDGALVIRAELPGIDPEKDVEVFVGDGYLQIRGERRSGETDKKEGQTRSEFHYGSFARMLSLPKGCRPDDVTASYKDGILVVRVAMPPAEEAPTARKIPVGRS
jgi:HSP20 family protein